MTNELKIVTEIVCDHFGMSPEIIQSRNRTRDVSEVRQICYYLSRNNTNNKLRVIAKEIGDRDHSDVSYSEKVVKGYMETYSHYEDEIEYLDQIINFRL